MTSCRAQTSEQSVPHLAIGATLFCELPFMAADLVAGDRWHADPMILDASFRLELVQVKSDGFPILVECVSQIGHIGGAHPTYATHDFDVKALVLKRSPQLGDRDDRHPPPPWGPTLTSCNALGLC